MESLANLFVVAVTVANATFPQANIPAVLGVQIAQENTVRESATSSGVRREEASDRRNEALEAARERRKAAVEEAKERRKTAIEEAKERRAGFREKLQEIRDEKKKKIVENIDARLSSLNEKWVNHWNKVLTRLTEVLAKIGSRLEKAKAAGRDTTSVEAAIATAEASIATAQSAVNAQAGKTYVIALGDEKNLGQDVRAAIDKFHKDIKATKDAIKASRSAVVDALKALKGIRGIDEVETEAEAQ